jgi:nitrate/TMAO reductase-like tetraheme cytochrome c subunit
MRFTRSISRRGVIIIGGVVAVALIGWCFAYEPVTRNFIAQDSVCTYCHLEREYQHTARMSFSKQHPVEPKEDDRIANCVDCHLPEGFWAATFAYSHFASFTDLFGHFRDRKGERVGDWIPMSAARAYRVRDRLMEYDSETCRTCHIEEEIKPKEPRGQKAHEDALRDKDTCAKCHANVNHRYVDVRETRVAMTGDEEGLDDDLEDDLDDDLDEGMEDDLDEGSEELEVL